MDSTRHKEPECNCRPPQDTRPIIPTSDLPRSSPTNVLGKYTRKEASLPVVRAASMAVSASPTYTLRETTRQYSTRDYSSLTMDMTWSNGNNGIIYSRQTDSGLEMVPGGDTYRNIGRGLSQC